eukprot:6252594-Lingulodinium_polyedra.AAC.1
MPLPIPGRTSQKLTLQVSLARGTNHAGQGKKTKVAHLTPVRIVVLWRGRRNARHNWRIQRGI